MADWYYSKGGNQAGPVSSQQLRQLVATGELQPTDHVWKDGMVAWVPVSQVSGLSAAPAAAPFPIAATAAPAPAIAAPTPQSDPALAQLAYATPVSMSGAGVMATGRSLDLLRQTRPWVRLISIVMLVLIGLFVVVTLLQMFMYSGRGAGELATVQVLMLVVVGGINGALAWLLSQYASNIGRLLKTRRESDLEAALQAQRTFWMVSGVLTLIGVIIYGVIFLVVIVGGMSYLFR